MKQAKNTPCHELTADEVAVLKQLAHSEMRDQVFREADYQRVQKEKANPTEASGPVRLSEGGELHWDHASHAESVEALIAACREPARDRPGIDGDLTAARMAEAVFSACRAGEWVACWAVAEWLQEAALSAVRDWGNNNDVQVWDQAGRLSAEMVEAYLP